MKRLTLGKLVLTLLALLTLLAGAAWLALVVGVSVDVQGNHHLTLINLGAREDLEIFWLTRLPRAIAAGIAGAGLAAAGTTFQAVLRNPLAEPFTLGVSSGAALGAVLAIHLGLETTVLGGNAVPLMAFIGALASVVMVWRVARVGSSRPPAMLLLAGVTFAFLCSAASMLVQYTATFSESYQILHWMSGGLTWVPYVDLVRSGSVVGLGLAVLIYLARDLNALAAGSEAAASVGVSVERVVAVAYIAASLVVGAVIAFAGRSASSASWCRTRCAPSSAGPSAAPPRVDPGRRGVRHGQRPGGADIDRPAPAPRGHSHRAHRRRVLSHAARPGKRGRPVVGRLGR